MRGLTLLGALLLVPPTFALSGCGDDDEQVAATRGTGRAPARKKPAKGKKGAKASKKGEVDNASLPPKLQNVDWSQGNELSRDVSDDRDPFKPYIEDLIVRDPDGPDGDDPSGPVDVVAGRFSVNELQLMAIITGTAVHKAMLVDPAELGHLVRQGDVVGREAMRVARITRNEVLFKPLTPPADENDPGEVRKVLLTQEELAELLP